MLPERIDDRTQVLWLLWGVVLPSLQAFWGTGLSGGMAAAPLGRALGGTRHVSRVLKDWLTILVAPQLKTQDGITEVVAE